MNTRFFTSLTTTVALLSLVACGGEDTVEKTATRNDKAVLISVQKTQTVDLPVWLTTVGQLHSRFVPTIAAEVEGRVIAVNADTGDEVDKGQLLGEIDTSLLILQQQAAQAGLDRLQVHITNGKRRVERFETLNAKDMSSATQVDDAREQLQAWQADYKAATAQLAIVEDALNKSVIVAPVSGVIQQRFVTAGDYVKRGDPLFEITSPQQLQAWLPFPESLALQIKVGQPAKIISPLTRGVVSQAEVSELQPSIGLGSRAVMAIVDLKDPGDLRPKATLSGTVLVETRKNAIMIPNISLVRRPAGEVVYVIVNDIAEARLVQTGHHQGKLVEITSGLEGGETIATDGAAFLTDKASVTITESSR